MCRSALDSMRVFWHFFKCNAGHYWTTAVEAADFLLFKIKKRRESILNLKEKKMKNWRKKNSRRSMAICLFASPTYLFVNVFFSGNQRRVVCTERARPCREEFFLSYFSLFYCLSTSSDRRENGVGCFDASSYFYFYFFFKNLLPARPAISQKSLINIDPNVWEKQTDRRQRNAQDFSSSSAGVTQK